MASIAVAITAPAGGWSAMVNTALQGAALLVALTGSRAGPALRWALIAIVLVSIAVTAFVAAPLQVIPALLNALILFAIPLVIVARFRRNLYVSVQSILGAICIYLVVGMVFANVDLALSALTGYDFFAGQVATPPSEYMYFSFITLATVGYGDLTPGAGIARALAVAEALMGQLYLVTVIALVVSNLGRERRGPGVG